MQDISTQIRSFRSTRGMTQADLAAIMGVTRAAVCLWENGYAHPSGRSLTKLNAMMNRWTTPTQHQPKVEAPTQASVDFASMLKRYEELKAELRTMEPVIAAYRAGMAAAAAQAQGQTTDNQLSA